MKKQTFCFKQLLLIAFGVCSVSTFVYGSTQNVTVSGAVNNSSSGSGKASINIGSSVNDGGSHNQSVSVGSIVNSSSGGKSEVNIGSVVKDY